LSIDYRVIPVGPFEANCFLIWDNATREAGVIDPGGDCESIVALIESLDLKVTRILITHGHPDHTFCAGKLASKYGARIVMHPSDVSIAEASRGIAEMYYDMSTYVPFAPDDLARDGVSIPLGESALKVVHLPGHSPGGVAFLADGMLFCGDTIFKDAVGLTDFVGGDWDQLIGSIKARILTLPDDTRLLPGHGPETTVAAERANNPYLK